MTRNAHIIDKTGQPIIQLLRASAHRPMVFGDTDPYSVPISEFNGEAPIEAQGTIVQGQTYRIRIETEVFLVRMTICRPTGQLDNPNRCLQLMGKIESK